MGYLILGIATLVGGLLLLGSFATANPATLARVGRWLVPGIAIVAGIFLLVTGRPALAIIPLAFFLISLIRQLSGGAGGAAWGGARGWRGGAKGKGSSEVETRYLHMTLDHETGGMSGIVLDGEFKGRQVDDLTFEEQIDLLHACWTDDERSAHILETYLDRTRENWREEAGAAGRRTGGPAGPAGGAMSRDEAYKVLGLDPGASEKEIRDAHRKLMTKHHPDHGGSTTIAAALNQAKEVLLGH